jgi:hypothetical protein
MQPRRNIGLVPAHGCKSVNPVKLNVSKEPGSPDGVATLKVSVTDPPPTSVPVNVTVGAGSKAKSRARSIESSENAAPSVCVKVMVAGANAASAFSPAFASDRLRKAVARVGTIENPAAAAADQRESLTLIRREDREGPRGNIVEIKDGCSPDRGSVERQPHCYGNYCAKRCSAQPHNLAPPLEPLPRD